MDSGSTIDVGGLEFYSNKTFKVQSINQSRWMTLPTFRWSITDEDYLTLPTLKMIDVWLGLWIWFMHA